MSRDDSVRAGLLVALTMLTYVPAMTGEFVWDDDSMLTKVHRSRGRWGRTRIFRGFMLLTNSSFKSLAAECSEELELLQTMFKNKVRITITEGAIELSPPEL